VLVSLHTQRGFSLIELMIGLVIMGILFTAGAPAFSDWIQNVRIRNSAESILNGLQLARAEAVRRNAPVRFQLTNSITNTCTIPAVDSPPNWVVSLDNPTALCATAASDTVAPRIIQTRGSSEGATTGILVQKSEVDPATGNAIGLPLFTGTLTFNGLGRIATTTLTAGNNATIDITNPDIDNCVSDPTPGTMRCLRILVSSAGQIRMCNPALNLATNPQGC